MYTLYIANKNYSSWSMRPWVLMRTRGLDFEEKLMPFHLHGGGRLPQLFTNGARALPVPRRSGDLGFAGDHGIPRGTTSRCLALVRRGASLGALRSRGDAFRLRQPAQ